MLDKGKQLDPDNIEIRYNEVRLLEQEGKRADAIAVLKGFWTALRGATMIRNSVRHAAKILEELGELYRKNEQYDLAIDTFRQMATLDPDSGALASAQVIDTYRASKDYAKADQESAAAADQVSERSCAA